MLASSNVGQWDSAHSWGTKATTRRPKGNGYDWVPFRNRFPENDQRPFLKTFLVVLMMHFSRSFFVSVPLLKPAMASELEKALWRFLSQEKGKYSPKINWISKGWLWNMLIFKAARWKFMPRNWKRDPLNKALTREKKTPLIITINFENKRRWQRSKMSCPPAGAKVPQIQLP